MEALGIPRGQYVIRVNNRKVLDGVMEAIGVTDEGQKLAVLRAIDKLDKFGIEGVKLLLGEGRKDESGDFTKGAGLDETKISKFLPVLEPSSADTVFAGRHGEKPGLYDFEYLPAELATEVQGQRYGQNEYPVGAFYGLLASVHGQVIAGEAAFALEEVFKFAGMVAAAGYDDRIRLNPSVVRGLEYYTGMVYEAELLFPVTNEKGEEVVFGSVGGGGRYDGLVSRFRGEPVPATGFSIGVSRLMTALKNLGKISTDTPQGPVVVCVMDRDIDALAGYQKMVQELRQAGIRAEMFQGNPKQFGKQLHYADRRNSPLCIIQGSNEREQGVVQIKDMIEGKREAAAFESNADYKAARPGQYEVPADSLVDEVKKRLAEQKADAS
jgi:histidyl-tRNA synthetase